MSPRPLKPRRCACAARWQGDLIFKPAGAPLRELGEVILGHDELEALALCDRDGLTQEEAAARMGVSRGTVQRLAAAARNKVASALTAPCALVVRSPP